MIKKNEFRKFCLQALFSYLLVVFSSLICLKFFELTEKNSFLISLIISFFYNFFFTILITFQSTINLKNFISYLLFSLLFRSIEYIIFLIIENNVDENYFIIISFVLIVSFLLKFVTLKSIYKK